MRLQVLTCDVGHVFTLPGGKKITEATHVSGDVLRALSFNECVRGLIPVSHSIIFKEVSCDSRK